MVNDKDRFAMIHELANSFAQRVDLDELIPFVVERCREILPASGVSLLLLEEQNNELTFAYVSEGDAEAGRRLIGMRIPADRGVAGAVLNKRCAELVVNVRDDSRHNSDVDRATGTSTGSLLAVPLIRGEHRLGVIEAVRRDGEPHFTPSDMSMLEVLGRTIAIALENAGRFGEIKASAEKLRVEVGALRRELARHDRFSEIIASSEAMSEVFNLMEAAAASSIPVLIEGETGTGKELAARAIHRTSDRADRPFVALNCAAVPEGLMESELFGHRRGAFTGALEDRHGLFRAASGGVLFLDEIGEMPAQMQAKLLRVLQEGEVTSVGDTRSHKVDVRVISATNVDLKAALEARAFREDLYYRLAAFTIRLPSLRERREDIEPLAVLTLDQAAQHHRKRIAGFAPEVIELFNNARWPGNVRQLQNEIERAVAVAREGDTVGLGHLSPQLMAACRLPASAVEAPVAVRLTPEVATASPKTLAEACSAFERSYIAETLERHNHNVSRASAALAISRVTLQKKMKEYSLRRPGA